MKNSEKIEKKAEISRDFILTKTFLGQSLKMMIFQKKK